MNHCRLPRLSVYPESYTFYFSLPIQLLLIHSTLLKVQEIRILTLAVSWYCKVYETMLTLCIVKSTLPQMIEFKTLIVAKTSTVACLCVKYGNYGVGHFKILDAIGFLGDDGLALGRVLSFKNSITRASSEPFPCLTASTNWVRFFFFFFWNE